MIMMMMMMVLVWKLNTRKKTNSVIVHLRHTFALVFFLHFFVFLLWERSYILLIWVKNESEWMEYINGLLNNPQFPFKCNFICYCSFYRSMRIVLRLPINLLFESFRSKWWYGNVFTATTTHRNKKDEIKMKERKKERNKLF